MINALSLSVCRSAAAKSPPLSRLSTGGIATSDKPDEEELSDGEGEVSPSLKSSFSFGIRSSCWQIVCLDNPQPGRDDSSTMIHDADMTPRPQAPIPGGAKSKNQNQLHRGGGVSLVAPPASLLPL